MTDRKLEEFSDEELILEFQENNTIKAFELLVKRFKNPLMNFVFRYLGSYEVTNDVVQETMIKVYKYKDSYKSIAKFSTWIYTIAGNLAKTELQRQKRKKMFSINAYGKEKDENYEIPDNSYRPDKLADSELRSELIQKAILKVSTAYRQAVILRDVQELSYDEIAEIMDVTVGTVKSRINRGRLQLQKLLKSIYKE